MLVEDCVDPMLHCVEHSTETVNIYNLGSEDWIRVKEIAEILVRELGLRKTVFKYTGGDKGWSGDVPRMMLSTEKRHRSGWEQKHGSQESVKKTCQILKYEIPVNQHQSPQDVHLP